MTVSSKSKAAILTGPGFDAISDPGSPWRATSSVSLRIRNVTFGMSVTFSDAGLKKLAMALEVVVDVALRLGGGDISRSVEATRLRAPGAIFSDVISAEG